MIRALSPVKVYPHREVSSINIPFPKPAKLHACGTAIKLYPRASACTNNEADERTDRDCDRKRSHESSAGRGVDGVADVVCGNAGVLGMRIITPGSPYTHVKQGSVWTLQRTQI